MLCDIRLSHLNDCNQSGNVQYFESLTVFVSREDSCLQQFSFCIAGVRLMSVAWLLVFVLAHGMKLSLAKVCKHCSSVASTAFRTNSMFPTLLLISPNAGLPAKFIKFLLLKRGDLRTTVCELFCTGNRVLTYAHACCLVREFVEWIPKSWQRKQFTPMFQNLLFRTSCFFKVFWQSEGIFARRAKCFRSSIFASCAHQQLRTTTQQCDQQNNKWTHQ